MKRSEAVSLIHSLVYNDPFNDDIAIVILDELEKAGMLPPKAYIEGSVRVGDGERTIYRNVHEWEPEDEEK
jgi:hypothetical protein